MRKTLKVIVIVVIAIAFAVFVLPRLVFGVLFSISEKSPQTPLSYMGSVWVCEEPYMCFEVCQDDWGTIGIGELETADGERMPVRFDFGWNNCCDIYRESAFWEIGEGGEPHITGPLEDPILECSYEMRKKDTVMTLSTSSGGEVYHGYVSATFYRQDPAGTEETTAQP